MMVSPVLTTIQIECKPEIRAAYENILYSGSYISVSVFGESKKFIAAYDEPKLSYFEKSQGFELVTIRAHEIIL